MVIHDYKIQYNNLFSSCIATIVITVCLGETAIAISFAAITAVAITAATIIASSIIAFSTTIFTTRKITLLAIAITLRRLLVVSTTVLVAWLNVAFELLTLKLGTTIVAEVASLIGSRHTCI